MSPAPDFRELVGDELSTEELRRLRRAHDALVAAGPPPELSPHLAEPSRPPRRESVLVRRRFAVLALAASLGVAAFIGGAVFGEQRAGFDPEFTVAMRGVGSERGALASLEVGERDEGGNWPMRLKVRGLTRLAARGYYELLLTKGARRIPCGNFTVHDGTTTVLLNAPYELEGSTGWVVAVHRRGHVENPPVIMTT